MLLLFIRVAVQSFVLRIDIIEDRFVEAAATVRRRARRLRQDGGCLLGIGALHGGARGAAIVGYAHAHHTDTRVVLEASQRRDHCRAPAEIGSTGRASRGTFSNLSVAFRTPGHCTSTNGEILHQQIRPRSAGCPAGQTRSLRVRMQDNLRQQPIDIGAPAIGRCGRQQDGRSGCKAQAQPPSEILAAGI